MCVQLIDVAWPLRPGIHLVNGNGLPMMMTIISKGALVIGLLNDNIIL